MIFKRFLFFFEGKGKWFFQFKGGKLFSGLVGVVKEREFLGKLLFVEKLNRWLKLRVKIIDKFVVGE